MCGIAGYICFKDELSNHISKIEFDDMVDIIAHRGPNDRGTYLEPRIALGHRRLSVIDTSNAGHQPFLYKDRYVVVYNGEIYNYREIRIALESEGYSFSTNSDTEILIAAYDCYGRDCLEYFNGMWSFAIYDKKENVIFASRDRFGIKPFYYYYDHDKGVLVFASEIKQILKVIKARPRSNKNALLRFLIEGDVDYTAETMFEGIQKLQYGHELIINLNDSSVEIEQYYDLREAVKSLPKKSYTEACQAFKDRFIDSVKLRLRSDVPLGYCLSGGLDSSTIVSVADKIVEEKSIAIEQHTISSCFHDKRYDEQEYIDEVVANTSAIPHKIFPTDVNIFEVVKDIIWHNDEPIPSTSQFAQWNVFKASKEAGMTVMLDGQGADEQLAGYTPFYGVLVADLLKKGKFIKAKQQLDAYRILRYSTDKHRNIGNIVLVAIVSILMPRRLSNVIRPYYGNDKQLPFEKKQKKEVYKDRLCYPMDKEKQYFYDSITMGLQALLHYEDRSSMAFSIESRVPFLDYKLVEEIYNMPLDYKLRDGRTKAVLRDAMKGILPEKIRNRYSKLGFETPEDAWINDNPQIYREQLIKACKRLAPLIDETRVLNWYDKNAGRIKRTDSLVWRIINAGIWADLYDVEIVG